MTKLNFLETSAVRVKPSPPQTSDRATWRPSRSWVASENGKAPALCRGQESGSASVRGAAPFLTDTSALLLGNANALGFGRGCEAGIGHHVVNGVFPSDDHLQVHWRRGLGGLVGSDGYGRILGSGPGVAHAVDHGDCAEHCDHPQDWGHAVEEGSEDD
jgi:hypothetical protein